MVGLADWFTYQHADGRVTAIKQTSARLQVVASRVDGAAWMLYSDPGGRVLVREGYAKTFNLACHAIDRARIREKRPPQVRRRQESPRYQQVHDLILADPTKTLEDIGREIGVTRERVRQIANKLVARGEMSDRKVLRQEAQKETRRLRVVTRERRKKIWLRMMFVAHRTRLRSLAHIDHTGMVRGYHAPGEETICQFEGCTRSVDVRGFCPLHYGHLRKTGALWVRRMSRSICEKEDCDLPVYARNMCYRHYRQWQRKTLGEDRGTRGISKYRGVTKTKGARSRWTAYITLPGKKQEYLGSFESEEVAARAYDTAARKYLGEKAKLNFPDENIEVVKKKRQNTDRPPSGYWGISWHESRSRWQVRITRNGKDIYVGRFLDLESAARAQDSAAYHYFGPGTKLNFPDEIPVPYVPPTERPKLVQKASKYRGVYWDKSANRWVARVGVNNKTYNFGKYKDEETAARAYDAGVREVIGEDAPQNFPGERVEVARLQRVTGKPNATGYRGISWHSKKKKWEARIVVNGKQYYLGRYADKIDAARAYDQAVRKYRGEDAMLNFPSEST